MLCDFPKLRFLGVIPSISDTLSLVPRPSSLSFPFLYHLAPEALFLMVKAVDNSVSVPQSQVWGGGFFIARVGLPLSVKLSLAFA